MHDVRLKICDLCGAPNLMENTECHVCGWRGHFSTEPAKVRSVIEAARKLQMHETARRNSPLCLLRSWFSGVWTQLQRWYYRRRRSYRFPF
ncbi:MAG: hypothetical protein KatS3mg022_1791 [Armatimonadota bacterium]|nr:MAG: hypothetical protein KatS3mg022_1791 [Armatimonadota bacterium]